MLPNKTGETEKQKESQFNMDQSVLHPPISLSLLSGPSPAVVGPEAAGRWAAGQTGKTRPVWSTPGRV